MGRVIMLGFNTQYNKTQHDYAKYCLFIVILSVVVLSVIVMNVVMLCGGTVIIGDHGSHPWQKQFRKDMKNSHCNYLTKEFETSVHSRL
jgi:hypothetical protein